MHLKSIAKSMLILHLRVLKINCVWMYNTKYTNEHGNIFTTSSNFILYRYLRLFYQYFSNNFEIVKCTCATAKFVISTIGTLMVFLSCVDFCAFCITSKYHTHYMLTILLLKCCQNIGEMLSKYCWHHSHWTGYGYLQQPTISMMAVNAQCQPNYISSQTDFDHV